MCWHILPSAMNTLFHGAVLLWDEAIGYAHAVRWTKLTQLNLYSITDGKLHRGVP